MESSSTVEVPQQSQRQQVKSSKNVGKLFKSKYSPEQLDEMAEIFQKFKATDLLDQYKDEKTEQTCLDFLSKSATGGKEKMKIEFTNA